MAIRIERADFGRADLAAFLQAHLDDLEPTAPPESRHALNLADLQAPTVRLWVMYDEDQIVGTGALATIIRGHEELKSMRTDPRRRRQGLARQMLDHLLKDAAKRGAYRVSLETGSMDFFKPARQLYESVGFTYCGPFGKYVDDPNSVFMTRLVGQENGGRGGS